MDLAQKNKGKKSSLDFVISILQQKVKERCFNVERKEFGDKSNFPVIAILLKQPLKGEFHNSTTRKKC